MAEPEEPQRARGRADIGSVPPPDEAQLALWLAAIGRGDTQALAVFYGQTSPQLFGLLLRMLKRRDIAEEVLHDVYVKVWQRAVSFDANRGSVMPWLIAVARHTALDRLRRTRYEVSYEADPPPELASDEPDPAAAAFATAESRALYECLDQLEAEPRDCVLLAYWDGLTHDDVARRLGKPLGTIKSWIRRSLLRLRDCLDMAHG